MDSTSESPSTPDLSVEPNEIRLSGKGGNVKKKNDLRFPQSKDIMMLYSFFNLFPSHLSDTLYMFRRNVKYTK